MVFIKLLNTILGACGGGRIGLSLQSYLLRK